MWTFLFGGRLSRIPYALIALPLILVQYWSPVIVMYAPIFFDKLFNADLVSFPRYMIALSLFMDLLVVGLAIVSAKRLRDIDVTGWLALPIVLTLVMDLAVGVLRTQVTANGTVMGMDAQPLLTWAFRGLYYFNLALALFLLIVPGRRLSSTRVSRAPAF